MNLDARLTATEAAMAVGVSKQVINYWRASGKISADKHKRYRFGDVIQLEARMRKAPQSSRGVAGRRLAAA